MNRLFGDSFGSVGRVAVALMVAFAMLAVPFAGAAAAYGGDETDAMGETIVADETVTVTENTTTLAVDLDFIDGVDTENASDVYVQVFDVSDESEVDNETVEPVDNSTETVEWDAESAGLVEDEEYRVVISTDDDGAFDNLESYSISLLDDDGDVLESVDGSGGVGGAGGLIDGVSNTMLLVIGLVVVGALYLRDN